MEKIKKLPEAVSGKRCKKCTHEMDRIDMDVDLKTLEARGGTMFMCSSCGYMVSTKAGA